jgi:hypothetical protein
MSRVMCSGRVVKYVVGGQMSRMRATGDLRCSRTTRVAAAPPRTTPPHLARHETLKMKTKVSLSALVLEIKDSVKVLP